MTTHTTHLTEQERALLPDMVISIADGACNATYPFAPLQGSAKQIVWADEIRREAYVRAHVATAKLTNKMAATRTSADYDLQYVLHQDFERLREITSARFWIDHRDDDLYSLLHAAQQQRGGYERSLAGLKARLESKFV